MSGGQCNMGFNIQHYSDAGEARLVCVADFCFFAMHGLQTRWISWPPSSSGSPHTKYPMKPAAAAKATLVPVCLSQWFVPKFTQF